MKRLSAALLVLGCTGCVTHVEHGQVDYRVADPATTTSACPAGKCAFGTLERRYLPSQLDETPFVPTDVFSLELEQGVIGVDILEGRVFGEEFGNRLFGDTAEVAVLANVFEFSSENSNKPAGFSYARPAGVARVPAEDGESAPPTDESLRLIYYSEDVHPSQPFNFSNIPLLSREAYGGGSIGIHLVVMEIDTGKGPVTALLKELAKKGQTLANAYTSGASDILFSLGESLFAGGQHDDILMDYKMVLSFAEDASATEAQFSPGRYVIYRQQDRGLPIKWSDLEIDHNTGRVYKKGDNLADLRDEMYFTIKINKYNKSVKPESFGQQKWAAFRQSYQAQAEENAASLDFSAVSREFRGLLVADTAGTMAGKVLGFWQSAEASLESYEGLAIRQEDLDRLAAEGCRLNPESVGERRDRHLRDARDAIREMVAEYRTALDVEVPGDSEAAAKIKPFATKTEEITSTVARFFLPWAAGSEAKFADATAFESAFMHDGGVAALFNEAKARSDARARLQYGAVPTCDKLMEGGIVPRSS
jgi:hypothetical protein